MFIKLVGQVTGTVRTEMTDRKFFQHFEKQAEATNIKPLAERNRLAVGAVGILIVVALVIAVFSYDKIPFIKGTSRLLGVLRRGRGHQVGQ